MKLIELSNLHQISGGCNLKCTCDQLLADIKEIPHKISNALPDTHKVEDKVKEVFPKKTRRHC